MLKIRVIGITSLIIFLLGIFLVNSVYEGTYSTLEQAQSNCGAKILVIQEDSPFYSIYEPDLTKDEVVNFLKSNPAEGPNTFTCTKHSADRMVKFEQMLSFSFYLLLLPIWLPLLLIGATVYWLIIELRNIKSHRKKT